VLGDDFLPVRASVIYYTTCMSQTQWCPGLFVLAVLLRRRSGSCGREEGNEERAELETIDVS